MKGTNPLLIVQVAVQHIVAVLFCDFMLEDRSAIVHFRSQRGIRGCLRRQAKAVSIALAANAITSIFLLSFCCGIVGLILMQSPQLAGEVSVNEILANLLVAYVTAALLPLMQQYNPSRRVFRLVRGIAFWRPRGVHGACGCCDNKSSGCCDSCFCCICCCHSSSSSFPSTSTSTRDSLPSYNDEKYRFKASDSLRLAAVFVFKKVIVDFFGICSWQFQREKTLRIIMAAISKRGEDSFSHFFADEKEIEKVETSRGECQWHQRQQQKGLIEMQWTNNAMIRDKDTESQNTKVAALAK